jgi:hypothetical protein
MKLKTNAKFTSILGRLWDKWLEGAPYDKCFDTFYEGIDLVVHPEASYNDPFETAKMAIKLAEKAGSKDVYRVSIYSDCDMYFIGNLEMLMKRLEKHCKKHKVDWKELTKGLR